MSSFLTFSLGSGGDAVVQSSRGAAELCLHVLSGHVERRLHLRRAPPLEVRRAETVCVEEICGSGEFNSGGKTLCSGENRDKVTGWRLFSHRPLFQGHTEVQQLQKIFE